MKEWTEKKRWNSFNSYKLLAHVERWKTIARGKPLPAPALITVDPTNKCNLNCSWCNARYILSERKGSLSSNFLNQLAEFLPRWSRNKNYSGVEAVCIAGGGEPLLNPATGEFIERLAMNSIESGVVTNGSKIDEFIEPLSRCTWVGISMDAATPATFNRVKNLSSQSNIFNKIIDNIYALNDFSLKNQRRLASGLPAYGITYKFLVSPDNLSEIYSAAKLAKETGCKAIHFRPAGTSWSNLGTEKEIVFSPDDVKNVQEQLKLAMELDDASFSVFGITHKFTDSFQINNVFETCHAVFMTAVVAPPDTDKQSHENGFTLGLCCDRRGDSRLELLKNCDDINQIAEMWGSEKHWQIFDNIKIAQDCPRCTYQPHNQIYENVILKDSMTYKFI